MALVKFSGIGIKSVSATVPKNIVETSKLLDYHSEKHLTSFIETTGVKERRIADKDMCSSDLCYDAAINLFNESDIKTEEVGALIFISQTPDYRVPGTSIIMQDRLKLSKSTLAFDVNMTCSGYIYGLFLAYSLANLHGVDNVLLLVGETLSKITSKRDKSTGLLLGDGGSATLISKGDKYGDSFFSLNTDGSSYESVIVPSGGFRNMSSEESLADKQDEEGNIRNDEQIRMDGMDVFSFAVSKIPKDIKRLLDFAGKDINDFDRFVFHQANKYMMKVIGKKAKLDASKMLFSIEKYGNTSGVSIPLTIADQKAHLQNNDLLLLNGIGAGFSWGSAILNFVDCTVLNVNEL
ncbi:ketoacyl-ACP synthase III [Ancylomarina salipaludis]|uniref:Ketoacyl-ACP synthase III n=1 Tax=Ancylomarina salipaludis TaxID=2501299 RepID=A0A4Q1JKI9_9BACT|nr:ketoacyl-ACP synthase III [Ancylomarina salipaludis]RXQ93863.1 ketoacyl-ACP synthase III [Ancylomarina salipaludis]